MSDVKGYNQEEMKAIVERAYHNSVTAVQMAENTHNQLLEKIIATQSITNAQSQQLQELQQKYNLLLSERFNGGSTSGD